MTSFRLVFADNFEFVLAKVIAVTCKFDVILIFASFFAILADDWILFDAQALAKVGFDFPFFLSSDAIFRNIVGEAEKYIKVSAKTIATASEMPRNFQVLSTPSKMTTMTAMQKKPLKRYCGKFKIALLNSPTHSIKTRPTAGAKTNADQISLRAISQCPIKPIGSVAIVQPIQF